MKKQKKIHWINHIIEFGVVFIAIISALMLNRWYEGYKNKQLEKKYLISFHKNITDDSKELETIIDNYDKTLNRVRQLKYNNLQFDSLIPILTDMSKFNQFIINLSTYESIKNSGDLGIISNYYLKEDLIKYYQQYEEKKLIESLFKSYIDNYYMPFIIDNIDVEGQKIINKFTIKNYKFTNLVNGYYTLLKQQIEFYKNLYMMGRDLKLKLDREINKSPKNKKITPKKRNKK